MSPNPAYARDVRKTLGVVLALNWLVSFLKLVFGYAIGSTGMVADGYHSFADGASNIIGLLGMRIASRPVDSDHPYGHKKYETFTSVFIAFLLFAVCLHLIHDSIENLRHRAAPDITLMSVSVMVLTVIVNVSVMTYEYRKGRRLGSDVLVADAMHTRADILTSCSVLAAFAGVKLGYPFLDSAVGLLIAAFIGASAIGILRGTSAVLCDTAVIDSAEIRRFVLQMNGVRQCHKIRSRGRADDIYLDLHVLVDDQMPLVRAHDMSSYIEEAIKSHFAGVTDVIVHIEPVSSEDHEERVDRTHGC